MRAIKDTIRTFVVENFLFGNDEGLTDEVSFMDQGIIDSTGILELIDYIESEFSISVEDHEMIPENLDSINNILKYLQKKM